MFGTTFSNTNQSQSPFGVQQAKQNTGFFGQTNPSPNSFGQNTTSAFGQIQNNPSFGQNTGGQGLFPGQQQQTLQGGPFGQSNPNQGGGGIFGQSTQQTNAPGLFGGQQQQQSGNSGLFGQQTSTNTVGIFGNQQPSTSNVFGGPQQGSQGGIFGQQSQPAQQGGLFGMQPNNTSQQTGMNPQGQGLFGASGSTQQGGGLFGQSNLSAPSNSTFGGVANNANQSFLGNQGNTFQGGSNLFGGANQNQNQNQGIGLFGSTQPSTSPFGAPNQGASNLFGGNTQQQQSAPGGNPLFGTFASPAQNATGNVFGAPSNQSNLFGGQPQAQQFGQNQNAFNQNTNLSNKLGGTSWGVPTNPVGATQASLVQPVRSKNSKLDAKHLVKCIVALDQFQGLSKQQLRVNFIQSGGQQPAISQQPVAGFKPVGQTTAPSSIPSLPSFGGSQNLGAPGGNLFGGGQTNPQSNLFVKPNVAGNFGASQQTSTLFGAPAQQQASMFGGQTQQQPPTTLFGAQQQQPSSLFGNPSQQQASMFGGQTQQQPPTTLFGAQQQQQPSTLFGGQPQQPTSTLFGAPSQSSSAFQPPPQPAQTSLFGAPPAMSPSPNTSLFGQANTPSQASLFNANPLQAPPSLFNPNQPQSQQPSSLFGASSIQPPNFAQALGTAVTASTSSLFNTNLPPNPYNLNSTPNPYNVTPTGGQLPSLFGPGGTSSLFGQTNSLINTPTPGQANQPAQMLLPLLLASLMSNQQPGSGGNINLDALNQVVAILNQANQNKPISLQNTSKNNFAGTTPFDKFLKEQPLLKSENKTEKYSLFSDSQLRQLQDIDSRNYYTHRLLEDEEENRMTQTYRPYYKKVEPFTQEDLRIVHKQYKAAQEKVKKQYTPLAEQLPQIGNYNISPSIEKLKNMTIPQIKKIERFKISNKYGSIQFLEPISVYKVNFTRAIKIAQDNIQITEPILQEKRIRITFNDFGNYTKLNRLEKEKLLRKMRQWIANRDMIEIRHENDTGNLVVETE